MINVGKNMNLICSAFKNFWYSFYNTCFRNIDMRIRYSVGGGLIVLFLLTFVACTKGKSKSELINNWFLFWLSMIFLIVGILYMSI